MNIKITKTISKLLALVSAVVLLNIGMVGAAPMFHRSVSLNAVFASSNVAPNCSAASGPTQGSNNTANCTNCEKVSAGNCAIIDDLVVIINFLAAGVGIVVVTMIVIGGIEYTISADNPQTVASARKKIINALIALVSFIFLYAFLNFIIPGGVF